MTPRSHYSVCTINNLEEHNVGNFRLQSLKEYVTLHYFKFCRFQATHVKEEELNKLFKQVVLVTSSFLMCEKASR